MLAGNQASRAFSVNPHAKMVPGPLSAHLPGKKKKKKESPEETIIFASAEALSAWLAN